MSLNFREQFEASQLYLKDVEVSKRDASDSLTILQQKLLVAQKPFRFPLLDQFFVIYNII